MANKVVVFDLDDTLYKEIEFLKSGYRFIVSKLGLEPMVYFEMLDWYYQKNNPFKLLIEKYHLNIEINTLINWYRYHLPQITPEIGVIELLEYLVNQNYKLGIITDGYAITQNNKITALGIRHFFEKIIISEEIGSEKPNKLNYLAISDHFGDNLVYSYIGDNLKKDFVTANKLGWQTICLKNDGRNIHSQEIKVDPEYYPKHFINILNSEFLTL